MAAGSGTVLLFVSKKSNDKSVALVGRLNENRSFTTSVKRPVPVRLENNTSKLVGSATKVGVLTAELFDNVLFDESVTVMVRLLAKSEAVKFKRNRLFIPPSVKSIPVPLVHST